MKILRLFLLLFLVKPNLSWAELKDENLLQNLPSGYKIDFQNRQGKMIMTEMVPKGETVNNWTEMVTTQVFLGEKRLTPQQFQASMAKSWQSACQNSEAASITSGQENGYPFALWLLSCPSNSTTGKPEITWIKAIKGNDSFYVIQKAFRFNPTEQQITKWMQYLRSAIVCDSRIPEQACPKTK